MKCKIDGESWKSLRGLEKKWSKDGAEIPDRWSKTTTRAPARTFGTTASNSKPYITELTCEDVI